MKARVSFDVDLSAFPAVASPDDAQALIGSHLIAPARAHHVAALHRIRADQSLDQDERAIAMARALMYIKMTLVAEANLSVVMLPSGEALADLLPFEQPQGAND